MTKDNLPALLAGKLVCHAMRFTGALSPVGHRLQTIVATKMLVDKALRRGAAAALVDTTGSVAQNVGFQLKLKSLREKRTFIENLAIHARLIGHGG